MLEAKSLWALQCVFTVSELRLAKKFLDIHPIATVSQIISQIAKDFERRDTLYMNYSEAFSKQFSHKILTYNDVETSTGHKILPGFPLALSYAGCCDILHLPTVAIVGTRHPTYYGREQAYRFAKYLSENQVLILSGGAIGIDTIANSVAHDHGASAVVLGNGLDCAHPPSNSWLFQSLAQSPLGVVLSEFPADAPPQKWNFPRRNQTLAALADFVLVLEAGETSGSLLTAHAALDMGRDVGALPGPVDAGESHGCHGLIQEGAWCVCRPEEVLERVRYLHHLRLQNLTPKPTTTPEKALGVKT